MKYINKVKLKLIHEILKPNEELNFQEIHELLELLMLVHYRDLE